MLYCCEKKGYGIYKAAERLAVTRYLLEDYVKEGEHDVEIISRQNVCTAS
jgi:hypothetical protein